jgi:acetyl esterase/lipase
MAISTKKLLTISFVFLFSFFLKVNYLQAQCNYSTSRYAVQSEFNVVYGIQPSWRGSMDTLKLDIFKPIGDQNTNRPVLFLVHGGGFSGGNKADVKALCETYASRGVDAIALGYRLGFVRPLQFDYPYILDAAEVNRAIFRSQQDAKGAIRFIKDRSAIDSTSINEVYIGGFSAGGIIALCAGYYTDSAYKYSNCGKIGDATNLNGTWARPDLGTVDGNLNQNGNNANVKGVFNFFGALSDTSFIKPGTPKLFQYHQTNDPVVPCGKNKPYWGMGLGISDNYSLVYGSCQIETRLKNLGVNAPQNETYIYNGNAHNVHDATGIDLKMATALEDWVCSNLGSSKSNSKPSIKIYPNPSNGTLQIDNLPSLIRMISIYNVNGIVIKSFSNLDSSLNIDNLSPGTYFIKIIGDDFNSTEKIVVE